MTSEQRKEMILNFKGFGNPLNNKKLCFIGIEEACGFDANWSDNEFDKEILKSYSCEYSPQGPSDYYFYKQEYKHLFGKPYTPVYEIMAKIISELIPRLELKEILDRYLFSCDGLAFQMNLYPLGKENLDVLLPNIVLNRFGFTNREEYLKTVEEIRFPRLYEFWNSMNFDLTICFGKTYWNEFRKCFHLNESKPIRDEVEKFELYGNRVVLTDFFVNFLFSEQRIKEFVNFIKRNVKLTIQ